MSANSLRPMPVGFATSPATGQEFRFIVAIELGDGLENYREFDEVPKS